MANIIASHAIARGSIPRVGIFSSFHSHILVAYGGCFGSVTLGLVNNVRAPGISKLPFLTDTVEHRRVNILGGLDRQYLTCEVIDIAHGLQARQFSHMERMIT